MALPCTANLASAFCAGDKYSGSAGRGGVIDEVEPSDRVISGICLFASSSRAVLVAMSYEWSGQLEGRSWIQVAD